jgi:polyphenol oxidase
MRRIPHYNGVVTFAFDILADYPVSVHVATRQGGVSPSPWNTLNFGVKRGDTRERVAANRRRLADALGLDATRLVTCQQVHGCEVAMVGPDAAGSMQMGADAAVTNSALLPLGLVFADCVPVALYDRRRHVLGVCHAGWRGTVQGAAVSTLGKMIEEYRSDPADVLAGIGPSIGPASYEVGEEVVSAARAQMPSAERLFVYRNGDRSNPYFDLWEANHSQLVDAGVPAAQIEVSGIDTATNLGDFFSHRAERGRCGLFAMVAWLHSEDDTDGASTAS